jgi:hypothetical protein
MIVQDFFGEQPRDLMQASFDDLSRYADFVACVGPVTVADIVRGRHPGAAFIAV